MITHRLQTHARKIDGLYALCVEVSTINDTRILGYITRYFAILAASYVEFAMQEIVRSYAESRANRNIANVVSNMVERQNSIDCNKIKKILDSFDKSLYAKFESQFDENKRDAINSLKNLRDALAHGNDNGTSYIKIKEYYDLVKDLPDKIKHTLESM